MKTPIADAIIATLEYIEPAFCCEDYRDLVDLTNEIIEACGDMKDEEFVELSLEKYKHECRKERLWIKQFNF